MLICGRPLSVRVTRCREDVFSKTDTLFPFLLILQKDPFLLRKPRGIGEDRLMLLILLFPLEGVGSFFLIFCILFLIELRLAPAQKNEPYPKQIHGDRKDRE